MAMDWGSVSGQELLVALREVDWNQKPRPLSEFFTRFTPPKTKAKWTSRLKCNAYYYRVNYFCLVILSFMLSFLRNPLAFVAVGLWCVTTLCLNDSFAASLSERAVRAARRIHPPLSAALRNPSAAAPAGRPYARSRVVYLLGRDRRVVVAVLYLLSGLLMVSTGALRTIARTLGLSLGACLVHASLRSPNLKARLNSYNEEFRAVWRGYAEA